MWSLRSLFVLGKGPCIKMQSAAGWFLITHLASTIRHTFSPVLSAEFITPPPVPQVTWGGSLSCSWAFCHHTRHSPIDRPYLTPPFGPGISECEWCIRLPLQVALQRKTCSAAPFVAAWPVGALRFVPFWSLLVLVQQLDKMALLQRWAQAPRTPPPPKGRVIAFIQFLPSTRFWS